MNEITHNIKPYKKATFKLLKTEGNFNICILINPNITKITAIVKYFKMKFKCNNL